MFLKKDIVISQKRYFIYSKTKLNILNQKNRLGFYTDIKKNPKTLIFSLKIILKQQYILNERPFLYLSGKQVCQGSIFPDLTTFKLN